MFGLSNSHPLSLAAAELTRGHKRTKDGHTGIEPPLLQMLEEAIASDSGRGTAAGVSRTGSPLNVGALHLWDSISAVVAEHWPGHGVLAQHKTPLIDRLTEWVQEVAGTDSELHLLEMCTWWAAQIRQQLEPVHPVPLRGTACLKCKAVTIPVQDEEGGTVLQPALLAHAHETPVMVECIGCGTAWTGGAIYQYQRQ